MEELGHSIVPPVPSLFTFNIKDDRLDGIQGISTHASVAILPKKVFLTDKKGLQLKSVDKEEPLLFSDGPVLVTHWGLSGPAILKLSAWGANLLHGLHYSFRIMINWTPDYSTPSMLAYLKKVKDVEPKKTIIRTNALEMPKRLWAKLVQAAGIHSEERWADVTKEKLQNLAEQLTASKFRVEGKSTFKEEFVTAGGVDLKEIDFKTFGSKLFPNLYFAGEIINVDAITGGFNFQNAWTGAYLAAQAIALSD